MADNVAVTPGSGDVIAADDVGGVKWQRVKLGVGADGSATDVSSAAPLPVEVAELPAAAALADGAANPTAASVGAAGLHWNGTTWDRQRGNEDQALLASAARTTTSASGIVTNYNGRGLMLVLSVTNIPGGAPSLVLTVNGQVNGVAYTIAPAPSAITTVSNYGFLYYPGVVTNSAFTQVNNVALPRAFQVVITHGNANTVTYRLDATILVKKGRPMKLLRTSRLSDGRIRLLIHLDDSKTTEAGEPDQAWLYQLTWPPKPDGTTAADYRDSIRAESRLLADLELGRRRDDQGTSLGGEGEDL